MSCSVDIGNGNGTELVDMFCWLRSAVFCGSNATGVMMPFNVLYFSDMIRSRTSPATFKDLQVSTQVLDNWAYTYNCKK